MKYLLNVLLAIFFIGLPAAYAQDDKVYTDNNEGDAEYNFQMPDMADTIRMFQSFQTELDSNLQNLDYEQLYSMAEQDMTDVEGMTELLKSSARMRQFQQDMIEKMLAASKDGKIGAQFQLAMIYNAGVPNIKGTVKLLKEAANNGHRGAKYILGFMYGYGDCVKKDIKEANKWLGGAISQGHKEAKKFFDEINSKTK